MCSLCVSDLRLWKNVRARHDPSQYRSKAPLPTYSRDWSRWKVQACTACWAVRHNMVACATSTESYLPLSDSERLTLNCFWFAMAVHSLPEIIARENRLNGPLWESCDLYLTEWIFVRNATYAQMIRFHSVRKVQLLFNWLGLCVEYGLCSNEWASMQKA